MRCVLYRRVSTEMQSEEGFSLEAQKGRLHAYAESQGWTVVGDYCDEGFSAKNTDRPQMQRLIKDISHKKFDVVLVYRLDRFVRSVLDLHELLQLMENYDVKFKSATEIFDTTSATGRLFITMIATLAQWERETIAERVHMGMLKKVEQGERNGAPAPYGYDLVGRELILNKEEAKHVKYMFDRYGSVGTLTIAKELNSMGVRTKKGEVWSDFSVRYILKNPIYSGLVRWNYESAAKGKRKKTGEQVLTELSQENFEPLITSNIFNQTQDILKQRSVSAFKSDNFYPFTGVLKCANCGYSFTGATKKMNSGKIHRYYKCRGRMAFGVCDTQSIAETAIEDAFLNVLELAETEIEIAPAPVTMTDVDIQKQLTLLTKRKERAEELYIDGDLSKDRYHKLQDDIRVDEKKWLDQLAISEVVQSNDDVKEILNNIKNEWPNFSYEIRKQAVHSLFESLTIQLTQKAIPKKQKAIVEVVDFKFN